MPHFSFFLFIISVLCFQTLVGQSSAQNVDPEHSNYFSDSNIQNSSPFMRLFQSRLWRNFVEHRSSNGIRMPFARARKRTPSTSEVIRRAGFSSEIHTVTTKDEYILTIDRIPGKAKEKENLAGNGKVEKKPVVLLFPNLLACSDGWFINSPEKSLPLLLAERNFDVWLANPRGCAYSKKHKWKNVNSPEFWNFSWHEMGVYDLTGMIDYILAETGHTQLNYIGYSLGTTVGFVLLCEKPEYNQKLNMSIHLGPSTYAGHLKSPIIRWVAQMSQRFPPSVWSEMLTGGTGELLPRKAPTLDFYRSFCLNMEGVCSAFNFATMGFDHCQYDKANMPRYFDYVPAGTSVNTVLHYLQLINNGTTFQQFDHGEEENQIRYKNPFPPSYNLSNVQSPQILFYSDGDWLPNSKDAKQTASEFSPKARVKMCRVKFSSFNHLDFVAAKDVNLLVNDRVIRVLNGHSCWADESPEKDADFDEQDEESIKCPPENPMVNAETVNRAMELLNRWTTNRIAGPNLQHLQQQES